MKEKIVRLWSGRWIHSRNPLVRFFLILLSGIYYLGYRGHRLLTRKKRLPVSVISVGNLTIGGTGKTPLVIELARRLKETRPGGVVMRGYQSRSGRSPRILNRPPSSEREVEEWGDEAVLIHEKTGCPVVISPDRVLGGRKLLHEKQVDWILLDDGFQHYRLYRDFDILVVDLNQNPEELRMFPRGYLREPLSEFQRADWIVGVMRTFVPDSYIDFWESRIKKRKPFSLVSYEIEGLYRAGKALEKIDGDRKIFAFCGIGHPEYFLSALGSLGIHPSETWIREDHCLYSHKDRKKIQKKIEEGFVAITTEKDLVKLKEWEKDLVVLRVKLEASEVFDELVEEITTRL